MSTELKKTAKHAMIYTIGVLLNRAVSFVMLPIYTRYLTPADYGTLELLTMTLDIVAIIAGLGVSEAIFRFYYRSDDNEYRNKLIATVTLLLIMSYFLTSVAGFLCSEKVASLILKGVEDSLLYTRLIFGCLFLESLIIVPLAFIKAQQKPVFFVSVTTARLLLQLSLNIYFVVVHRMHVLGVLYSSIISDFVIGLFLTIYTLATVGVGFSTDISRSVIKFGSPLIVSSLASFILTFSDRYFLKAYSTLDVVGVYSLGYKLGFVLWMFTARPFFNIWDPKRFELARKPDFVQINNKMFIIFNLWMISFGLAVSLFSIDLFHIMSAKGFWDAYKIVPIIVFAYIIQGWTVFTNFGILYKGKTIYIAYGTSIAAVTIVLLSFLLIPTYAGIGAAIATVLAFLVRFLFIYYKSLIYYKLRLNWIKVLLLLSLAFLISILSKLASHDNFLYSLLLNAFLFSVYWIVLLVGPILDTEEKETILGIIRNPIMTAKQIASI